jgi:uncharacterized integral membrane protein
MRKFIFLVVFGCIFILSAAFAAFNLNEVTVDAYFAQFTLPLSIVIVIAILFGLIMGVLILLLSTVKLHYDNRRLRHRLTLSEQELNSLRMLPVKDTP